MAKQTKQYSIGIDVGGTKMSAVLFDGTKVIADYILATPTDDLEHFLIMMKALVEPLEERAKIDKVKIKGLGLGIAGVINYAEGRILNSPNLTILNGVKIVEQVEAFLGVNAVLDNDANAFVRAEATIGAAKDFKNVYGVIIGTGIGGGWWINGEVYKGAHGGAGEPGEMIIDMASGLALEKMYHQVAQNNPGKLAQEAFRADPLAERAFEEIGRYLGIALANIVNLIDPEVFVLGGGVMESANLFLPELKKTMKAHIQSSESAKKIKVMKAKLGQQAGAIGAALLV